MNVEFSEVVLRWVEADTWEVYETLKVTIDGRVIYVPKGFRTDLASIPKTLWPMLSPMGPYTPAGVLHDYLYKVQPCTKDTADECFYQAMISLGVDVITAKLMFAAVDKFGNAAWEGHLNHLKNGVVVDMKA